MKVVICDKCERRCDKDVYQVTLGNQKYDDPSTVDLCAACAHPLQDVLPAKVRHLLPSKDRAEMVAKTDPNKAPPQ